MVIHQDFPKWGLTGGKTLVSRYPNDLEGYSLLTTGDLDIERTVIQEAITKNTEEVWLWDFAAGKDVPLNIVRVKGCSSLYAVDGRLQYNPDEIRVVDDRNHRLGDGVWIFNDFGKYRPNMTFVADNLGGFVLQSGLKNSMLESELKELDTRLKVQYRGHLYTSKKGKTCFKVDPNGSEVFISADWDGYKEHNDGVLVGFDKHALWTWEGKSNGGGIGTVYMVVPINVKALVLDDMLIDVEE
jgi:hypothetical protein